MKPQKRTPIPASRAVRTKRPRSPERARARAVRNFGPSRWSSAGFGRTAEVMFAPPTAAAGRTSDIQDLDQLPRRILAGEPEEDLLETARVVARSGAQLRHRAR